METYTSHLSDKILLNRFKPLTASSQKIGFFYIINTIFTMYCSFYICSNTMQGKELPVIFQYCLCLYVSFDSF